MIDRGYHYEECGLENVYLKNGFRKVDTPYGDAVEIQHIEGLHKAIGLMLAEECSDLNGKEFRFLRHEINMTQKSLAEILKVTELTVARWEKGETKVDGPAQAVIRLLYLEYVRESPGIAEALRRLAEIDEALCRDDRLAFEDTDDGWQRAA